MVPILKRVSTISIAAVLGLGVACNKKAQQDASQQAQAVTQSADQRVAQLEKELSDLKAGKAHKEVQDADRATVEHVSRSRQRALEQELQDARRHAQVARQEAADLTTRGRDESRAAVQEVPAGTRLLVALKEDLSTEKAQAGDRWEGTLAQDVTVDGKAVWPQGTPVRGTVTESVPAGRLSSGKGALSLKLTEVDANGVEAGNYVVVGDAKGERNAKYIGGGAALGALVGILSDKSNQRDHALAGAAAGAVAGTAAAAATGDTAIRIPASKPVEFTLNSSEKVIQRRNG